MTYSISQADPAQLSTEEITAEIDGFIELAEEVVARLSVLLAELRKRRQPHPFFQHAVLRFWQSIADQTLHPKAAIILANREMIKAIIPLPHKDQLEIAYGRYIPVAVTRPDGSVASDDMPIQRMDTATLRRAFGAAGLRTVHEQAEMIREEGKITRIGMITVLRDEQALKIGNQKIRPEDLKGPLAALGYKIDLTRSSGEDAA
jgi:hypothetical protein